MWVQVALSTLLALLAAPCVLQRVCPARTPRPPPSVCMHRMQPTDNRGTVRRQNNAATRAHKACGRALRARVLLSALLRLPLAAVLLLLPLHVLPPGRRVMLPWLLVALFAAYQAAPECKNCVMLGKEERAMFAAHSEACLAQSAADPARVARLLRGEAADGPALRRHVYCVLLRCKLIGKDGKPHKAALLPAPAARNATKVAEGCAEQDGDSPEDLAWNLFRCGLDKKAALRHHAPAPPTNRAL